MLWSANSFLFLDMDSGYLILIQPNPHLPLQFSYPWLLFTHLTLLHVNILTLLHAACLEFCAFPLQLSSVWIQSFSFGIM